MTTKKLTTKKPVVKKEKKEPIEPIEPVEKEIKKPLKKKEFDYIYKVGRRKNAIAQVRFYLKDGGKIEVNKKDYQQFFPYHEYQEIISAPLKLMGEEKHDVKIFVKGGGVRGQAEAIRLGIARALVQYNPDYKKSLRGVGYLTRDPRVKERKKPGLKRARRAPQWSKR